MKHLLLIFLILCNLSYAKLSDYDTYFQSAGSHYNIPPLLLKNIAAIESSGNPNAIRINDNGTRDYGLMQINSIHFKTLAQWGINHDNILNPKVNIFVGSWLVSQHIKEKGFNLEAIGNYHSKTPKYKEVWLRRLTVALKKSPQR
jgi:lysozyme-related protein Hpa2